MAENPMTLWDPGLNSFDVVAYDGDKIITYLCNEPADDSTLGFVTKMANA